MSRGSRSSSRPALSSGIARSSRIALSFLAGFVLFPLGAAPARADGETETTFNVSNQLEFFWDTKVSETLLDDRLDAAATRGHYSVGAVFLSHSPSTLGGLDPNDYDAPRYGIRKRWVEANYDDWAVRAGHVYATFGRGVALAVREDQVIDFDNALDGVLGKARYGKWGATVIGGTNSFNVPLLLLDENAITMKGLETTYDLSPGTTLGLEGVWADSMGATNHARLKEDRVGGGYLTTSLGELADFHGEYLVHKHETYRGNRQELPDGHAGYLNVSLYLGRLQLLTEYKDLLRYNLPFVNPPSTVRQHNTTLLNRGSHAANIRKADERGGLVEAILALDSSTRATAAYSKNEARKSYQPAWEVYGEVERWFGGTELIVRAGETEEILNEGESEKFTERITETMSLLFPLNEQWSVETAVETQGVQVEDRVTRDFQRPREFRDTLASVTLSRAPGLSFAVTAEWTGDEEEKAKSSGQDSWLWGECNVRLGSRHNLSIGGGSIKGGQICSGGVCKIVDPFEGGRVELLTTF